MKFTSKSDFVEATEYHWALLWESVDSCEIGSTHDKELKQILAHLYCWHRLVLGWFKQGKTGTPDLPAKGFNWQQTKSLNAKLDEEMAPIPMDSIKRRLRISHRKVLKLVEELSEKQLLEAGHFAWTGKNALSSYITPNTVSHYRWAIKKIKKIDKNFKN